MMRDIFLMKIFACNLIPYFYSIVKCMIIQTLDIYTVIQYTHIFSEDTYLRSYILFIFIDLSLNIHSLIYTWKYYCMIKKIEEK